MYGDIADRPSVLTMSRLVLEENEQTSTAGNADNGGGGLYIQYNSSAVLRETTFIGNIAKADSAGSGNYGHQIMTHKANSAYTTSLGVTLINSRVENCVESFCSTAGNFYGYNEGPGGGGAVANYIGTKTCGTSPSPCAVFPFTGTCTARSSGNLGVLCNYGADLSCPYTKFNVTESTLPPPLAYCSRCIPVTKGTLERLVDCTMVDGVELSGDFAVTGRASLTTVTAAPGRRHFTVTGSDTLTLKWLRLTGSDISSNTWPQPCAHRTLHNKRVSGALSCT